MHDSIGVRHAHPPLGFTLNVAMVIISTLGLLVAVGVETYHRVTAKTPPTDAQTRAHVRALLRAFFAPLLRSGAHRIELGPGVQARELLKDKRAMTPLKLPGRLLFLFRLRFGLYSILAQLGSCSDWAGLESAWAEEALD